MNAIKAILARINGEWDQPDLMAFGALSSDALADIKAIAEAHDDRDTPAFNALFELVECAELRGDADLPHPADDEKHWTARMQEAWDTARELTAGPDFDSSLGASRMVER